MFRRRRPAALPFVAAACSRVRSRCDPGHPFGRAARRAPARRRLLQCQRQQRLGRRGAAGERARADADARRRARDRVPRARPGPLLGGDPGRAVGGDVRRRRGDVSPRRCARRVEHAGAARQRRVRLDGRNEERPAAGAPRLPRQQRVDVGRARRRRRGPPHLRLHRLRPAAVQSADLGPAAPAPPARRRRQRLDRCLRAARRGRVARPPGRRRGDAREDERDDVRRRGPALRRPAAGREPRLAGGAARPLRRPDPWR